MSEDFVNPRHYQTEDGKQVWELMIDKFGVEAFLNFCDLNVFKYEQRKGKKTTEDKDYDEAKAEWYRKMAQRIRLSHMMKGDEELGLYLNYQEEYRDGKGY